jgi:hypothetical protein
MIINISNINDSNLLANIELKKNIYIKSYFTLLLNRKYEKEIISQYKDLSK